MIVQRYGIFCLCVLQKLHHTTAVFLQLAVFFCLIIDFDGLSMTVHKETHHFLLMAAVGFHSTAITKCVQPVSY